MNAVAWTPDPAPEQVGWLQRITPVHMGLLMALVTVMLVMTGGPTAMKADPARLPAASVAGGGPGGVETGVAPPVRAGSTATKAAAAPTDAKGAKVATDAKASPGAKGRQAPTRVRNQRSNLMRGIPSPAAAAQMAVAGGGRVSKDQTSVMAMRGMPSPAAAAQLGPQTLPMRPNDGVTLPRTGGERDSHAVDTYYGATSLPMEEPAAPILTPGDAAASAQHAATMQQLRGDAAGAAAPAPSAGVVWAF